MLAVTVDTALGVAAVIASLSGLVMTIFTYISGRKDATRKAQAECHKLLMEEQRISERLSAELHQLRMGEQR